MKKIVASTVSGIFLLAASSGASAQANAALAQAKARLACGAGTVVSSQFLADGTIRVTCSQPQATPDSAVIEGTGLATPTTVGAVAIATVVVILSGGSDVGTTTTTTTTTSSANR